MSLQKPRTRGINHLAACNPIRYPLRAVATLPNTTDHLTDLERAAWGGYLRSHAAIVRQLDATLVEAHGLPLSSFEVLARLAQQDEGKQRMSDLAQSVWLSRSGVTRLVDRLERDGLVERQRMRLRRSWRLCGDHRRRPGAAGDGPAHARQRRARALPVAVRRRRAGAAGRVLGPALVVGWLIPRAARRRTGLGHAGRHDRPWPGHLQPALSDALDVQPAPSCARIHASREINHRMTSSSPPISST